jgi:nucleoid DNA-binding protein
MAKTAAKKSGPRTKSDVFRELADGAGITKKQVAAVFEGMNEMIKKDLSRGPGIFTVPGLMKITVIKKPATKAREGTNPFTGEKMMFKAKPARKVVKVRPLKGLKAMVM